MVVHTLVIEVYGEWWVSVHPTRQEALDSLFKPDEDGDVPGWKSLGAPYAAKAEFYMADDGHQAQITEHELTEPVSLLC